MFSNLKIQGNKDISFSLFLVVDIWNFYCNLKLLNGNGVFLFSFGNGFYGFTNKNMHDSKLLAEKFVMCHTILPENSSRQKRTIRILYKELEREQWKV